MDEEDRSWFRVDLKMAAVSSFVIFVIATMIYTPLGEIVTHYIAREVVETKSVKYDYVAIDTIGIVVLSYTNNGNIGKDTGNVMIKDEDRYILVGSRTTVVYFMKNLCKIKIIKSR